MTVDTAETVIKPPAPKSMADIPGWFYWLDRAMFNSVLESQRQSAPGHLVELGTYLGKSAVVVGEYLRPTERFVVVDLFEGIDVLSETDADRANLEESLRSYKSLTRQAFEVNYQAIRGDLPEVVAGMSSEIVDHLEPGSVRFIHIDASHLYEAVRVDVESAKLLLRPGGVVVFDDIRSEHTPGVTAAAWEAVFKHGLIPIALTTQKLYAVFSEPDAARAAVHDLIARDDRVWHEVQEIAGHPVIRLGISAKAKKRDDERKAAAAESERLDRERTIAEARAEATALAEQSTAARVAEARRTAVEEFRTNQAEERAAASRAKEAARRATEPRTVPGKIKRTLAREVVPPALTRALVNRRNR